MPGRWNRTMDSKENGEYGYSVDEPEMAAAGQLAAKYNLEWQPAEHLPVDQDEAREPWSREQRTRESCARNQFTPLQ